MPNPKIPGFRVRVVDKTSGQDVDLRTQEFKEAPGTDFLDFQYGANRWDNIRVRRKTFDGNMAVTFRQQTAGQKMQRLHAAPGQPAELPTATGQLFRVVVEQLPKAEWAAGRALKFAPPSASIVAEPNGWRVTFSPQQYPCVLTIAVDTTGTKDENLPSFPFPANPKFASGSFVIPYGQFGATEGAIVRLGVRGAGLETRVALPIRGQRADVDPGTFEVKGPAQPELMTDVYVNEKYAEKMGIIQYG